jgi:aspartate ammonia-lyase
MGYDSVIALACASGNLELNPFLPLVAACLLESFDLLARACEILCAHCVEGIEADEARCRAHVEDSTAILTALVPVLGYERACEVAQRVKATGKTVREIVLSEHLLSTEAFDQLTSPETVCRLGSPNPPK